jgi:hypothetical protein
LPKQSLIHAAIKASVLVTDFLPFCSLKGYTILLAEGVPQLDSSKFAAQGNESMETCSGVARHPKEEASKSLNGTTVERDLSWLATLGHIHVESQPSLALLQVNWTHPSFSAGS